MSSLARRPARDGTGFPARRMLYAALWIVASSVVATVVGRALVEPLPSFPFLFAIVLVAVAAGLVAGFVEVALSVFLLDVVVLPGSGAPASTPPTSSPCSPSRPPAAPSFS